MKKYLYSLFLVLLCVFSCVRPALASDPVGGGTVSGGSVFTQSSQTGDGRYGHIASPDEVLGQNTGDVVTTEDVNDWVDRKGDDVIKIITRVVQVAAFAGFLVSLGVIIVGAVGNKRLLVGGFIGLLVACAAYTMATCAPQIIYSVSSWLRN